MKKISEMNIHIIGIGGTGMAPIAIVLHEMGAKVSGSDRSESVYTRDLLSRGIDVKIPQRPENIDTPDIVFYSSAIHDDNPELAEARRKGIRTLKRREFLGLMLAGRKVVAVAGSHGKSTTTSMAAWVLSELGIEPGFIVGSSLKDLGRSASAGQSEWFVIESDEYDNMFLGLTPFIAALTKVEYDHPDCFPTKGSYIEAFEKFLEKTYPDGKIFLNSDDPVQNSLRLPEGRTILRYGIHNPCSYRAENLLIEGNGCYSFDFCHDGGTVRVKLSVPGDHNVYNALLVMSICASNGWDLMKAAEALEKFSGIGRRFEVICEWNGITLVDDYAHHPTEIAATLKAAREKYPDRRIWAVWQPHTYSRTKSLLDEFSVSFGNADEVIITDIFAARESYSGFGVEDVIKAMRHPSVHLCRTIEDTASFLSAHLKEGDVVVTLSAGDANKAAPMALEMIKNASL